MKPCVVHWYSCSMLRHVQGTSEKMKSFLLLFPFIQSTYIVKNYDVHVYDFCTCKSGTLSKYQCKNCYLQSPCCAKCIKVIHHHLSFHQIEKWNGWYFEKTSLWQLGFMFSLGHGGYPCPNQLGTAFCKVIIVDVNGYHNINFQFFSIGMESLMRWNSCFCISYFLLPPNTQKQSSLERSWIILMSTIAHQSCLWILSVLLCKRCQVQSYQIMCWWVYPLDIVIVIAHNIFKICIIHLCKPRTFTNTYKSYSGVNKHITLTSSLHIDRRTASLWFASLVLSLSGTLIWRF